MKPRKAERLTPIPTPKSRGSAAPSNGKAGSTAQTVTPPDLSYIAPGLHALAVPIGELQFDPANARLHPEPNVEAIKGSLTAYGQCKPVVVRRDSGVVVAGNGTLKAALSLGWTHLAAVYVDMDSATAAGFAIADNRTAELADWDKTALDKLMREVSTKGDERLDAMMAELAKDQGIVPGDAPASKPPADPEPDATASLECPACGHQFTAQAMVANLVSRGLPANFSCTTKDG